MEDSFKVRVDRIFGSLSSSSSSTAALNSSLSSLWSLTDDEIERREWIKGKEDPPEPGRKVNGRNSFGFRDEFEDDLEADLDENPESNGSSSKLPKPDDYGDEEWEIKSSIGRDCTLDYEEEEDEYDKVAVGKEKGGDRLYMKDIADCGIEIDSCIELPTSVRNFTRDPRANHLAAKIRLKEDAEASKTIDSLHTSENGALAIADPECNASRNPKSILKRKDNHLDTKSQKRVRFNPECKISQDSQGSKDISMEGNSSPEDADVANEATFSAGYRTQVPDYIQNPSRYTHYTFDSSNDDDEGFNKKVYMDFLQLLSGSKSMESHQDDASTGPPKSITFIPKKKPGDTVMLKTSSGSQNGAGKKVAHQRDMAIGIAAVDVKISQGSKDISMEGNSSPEDGDVANEATFSSADDDGGFNKKVYMDFLQMLSQDDASTSPPKSITFIPKKKPGDTVMLKTSSGSQNGAGKKVAHQRDMAIGIAAVDVEISQGSKDISMEGNSSPEDGDVANEATFSPADDDGGFNKKVYMDFLQLLSQDDASTGPPKSITFIPKKKPGDTVMLETSSGSQNGAGKKVAHQRGIAFGIAAVDAQTDDVCSMEEDEPDKLEMRRNGSQKPGRQYRMKAKMDSEEEA